MYYEYSIPYPDNTMFFPQNFRQPEEVDDRFLGLGFGAPGLGFRPGFGAWGWNRPWFGGGWGWNRPWFGGGWGWRRPWFGGGWGRW